MPNFFSFLSAIGILNCCLISILPGQTPLIDSLKSTLSLETKDSSTINTLNDICWELESIEKYDSLLHYAQLMAQISSSLGYFNEVGLANYKMASSHWHLGDYQEALNTCDSAFFYFQKAKNDKRIMHSTYLRGMINGDQGNYAKAISDYYEGIKMAKNMEDSIAAGAILNSVALVHKWMSNYRLAEEEFLNSIEMLKGPSADYRRAMSITNLGVLYTLTEQYQEAIENSKKAMLLFEKLESDWGVASNKGNIGTALVRLNKAKEAISYLKEHLKYEEDNDPKSHAAALMMLAEAEQSLTNLEAAKAGYQNALTISSNIGALDYQRQCEEALSQIAASKNDFRSAFAHLLNAKSLGDTLYNQKTADKVAELNEQYQAEKKENQIALLKSENKVKDIALSNEAIKRNSLMGGMTTLLLLAALVWYGQRQAIKNQRLLAIKNEKIKDVQFQQAVSELELKALRAQMNPHFIFNCMNSINRLILENDNENASRLLSKFSRLIRLILEHSERKTISLEEEMELLTTYLEIETRRFEGNIDYSIAIDKDIDPEYIEVPSMVLQPFIENAIWHGLFHKNDKAGKIKINIRQEDEILHCSIEDNGIGRKKALELKNKSVLNHKSMALKLTEARLKLIDKTKIGQLIKIIDLKDSQSLPAGTRVEVKIPI